MKTRFVFIIACSCFLICLGNPSPGFSQTTSDPVAEYEKIFGKEEAFMDNFEKEVSSPIEKYIGIIVGIVAFQLFVRSL